MIIDIHSAQNIYSNCQVNFLIFVELSGISKICMTCVADTYQVLLCEAQLVCKVCAKAKY